jgi:hypothetical protein
MIGAAGAAGAAGARGIIGVAGAEGADLAVGAEGAGLAGAGDAGLGAGAALKSRWLREVGITGLPGGIVPGGGGVGAEVKVLRTGAAGTWGAAGAGRGAWAFGAGAGWAFAGPIEKMRPWA